jgi:phage FluMu protein Com
MAITLDCPSCGRSLNVPDTLAGKKVKCPQCEESVSVPAEDSEAVTQEPRSPQPAGRRQPRRPDEDDDEDLRSIRRQSDDGGFSSLIPYKNGKALVAYYCGVFSLIPCLGLILGPIALIFGILGYRYAKAYPTAKGMGHAIAGIVLGGLSTVGNWGITLVMLIGALVGASGH